MSLPVLLITFNRPEETEQVLKAIQGWDISTLYVSSDGPREGHPTDTELCQRTRALALTAGENHQIRTMFNETNLGCGRAVAQAIDWFFEHEEAGIILEDDCVPHSDFFRFCEGLLDCYAMNETVMMISGSNFLCELPLPLNSYTFTRYPRIWGWATWRRAWEHFDFDMTDWPILRESRWLKGICKGHRSTERYWKKIFDTMSRGGIDTWDYQWFFAIWKANGISVIPPLNLIDNVGFGPNATHTSEIPDWYQRTPRGSLEFPLDPPVVVASNPRVDRLMESHIYQTRLPLQRRIIRSLKWRVLCC